jgi:hypothetical protein
MDGEAGRHEIAGARFKHEFSSWRQRGAKIEAGGALAGVKRQFQALAVG